MKEYEVKFEIDGEIHKLEFSDNISNSGVRRVNAKIWIDDYINQNFNGERKIYSIIDIKEI